MTRWLPEAAIRSMHRELLAEHGGLDGTVDENMLGATLGRPRHLEAYGHPTPSIFQLAAAYRFGFAKNHCFKDGNKRIALTAIDVFLQLNGWELTASEPDAVDTITTLAQGTLTETDPADWIERNVRRFESCAARRVPSTRIGPQ